MSTASQSTSPLMPMANAALETLTAVINTDPSLREHVMNSLWRIVTTQPQPAAMTPLEVNTPAEAASPSCQTDHGTTVRTSKTAPYYRVENVSENQPAPPLNQVRHVEATITQFLEGLLTRARWPRLPVQFIYDAYQAWMSKYHPTSYVASQQFFECTMATQIPEIAPWWVRRTRTIFTEITYPEPLIAEWDIANWKNPEAAPDDLERLCTPRHPQFRNNVYVDSRRCKVYRGGNPSTHKKRGRPRKVTQTVNVNIQT